MAHPFIGRRQELQLLQSAYESGESGFIPIYGRRRVGKSELILRFLNHKPALYFQGKKAPAALQMQEFQQEAAAATREPLLAAGAPTRTPAANSRRGTPSHPGYKRRRQPRQC